MAGPRKNEASHGESESQTICKLTAKFLVTETEAAKETTETPAADTTAAPAKEEAKEEAKKEAEPVEDGQLEHKGSNFPK